MAFLLFVTGTAPDVQSGSGTFVGISVLAEALRARGHRVEVLAPASGRGPVSLPSRLLFNWRARNAARRLRPEAVVGFDWDGIFVRTPAAVANVASIKGVLAEEAACERGAARLRLSIEARFEAIRVRRAGRIVATSDHSAERLTRAYGADSRRVVVVPEPIDLARWREALSAAGASDAGRNGRAIVCVAHLYPRKDVATLLAAMARLPADVTLRVVGTGPELPRLERMAQTLSLGGRVRFLGHIPFGELAREYRRADIFCLPSRQEGFGIVFLEAMAAGLPIVAAHAAAVPEVVPDGVAGILIPPGDAAALASALARLIEDSAGRRRLSEGGARRVEQFDAARVAARFLEAIGLAQK